MVTIASWVGGRPKVGLFFLGHGERVRMMMVVTFGVLVVSPTIKCLAVGCQQCMSHGSQGPWDKIWGLAGFAFNNFKA